MNVFNTIYLGNDDQLDREYTAIEMEMDIAVARAQKEYALESGLIELSDDTLFMESSNPDAGTKAKRENSFIKAIKAICTAIYNFIRDMINTISSIFDNRENITAEDYFESPTGKLRFNRDAREIEASVSAEIRQGNKLLQKLSSMTGISDEVIDTWIKSSTEKITKALPVVIPAAMAFGFKTIFTKSLKSNSDEVRSAERTATSGDTTDPDRTRKATKIFAHMQTMVKELGKTVHDWSKVMRDARKKVK